MSEAILLGYHFTPTEEELIRILVAFLECKAQGKQFPSSPVVEKVLYGENATPWEIFDEDDAWESADGDAGKKGVKQVVYVLTQLSAMSEKKKARTAGCGTWDGQTGIKEVENRKGQIIGVKKMLSFKVKGDSEFQEKGQWRMHEYALSGVSLEQMASKKIDIGHYVICKITRDYSKCENPTNDQILGKRKSDDEEETSHKNRKYLTLMELENYEAERIKCQEGQINDQQVVVSSFEHWADTYASEDDDVKRHLEWSSSAVDYELYIDGLALAEMKDLTSWESLANISHP